MTPFEKLALRALRWLIWFSLNQYQGHKGMPVYSRGEDLMLELRKATGEDEQ